MTTDYKSKRDALLVKLEEACAEQPGYTEYAPGYFLEALELTLQAHGLDQEIILEALASAVDIQAQSAQGE